MIAARRLFLALVVFLVATVARAASLTPAQMATLKADIAADATLNAQPTTYDGAITIAAAYNLTAAPDYWVWRTAVSRDELVNSTSIDGTTFNWTGAGYITRSQGERDAFAAIFNSLGQVDPSRPSVRQAFSDIFSGGVAPAPANRTHLLAVSRRKATRAERLFATGTGSTASPAVMGFEGQLNPLDVYNARLLP